MAEFRGYRCWNPIVAANTISTEAVSPSSAVFFATHTPLRIHRTSADGIRTDTPGVAVDEEAVRHDFLTRPTANGVLLMPVIGESGTGKSHLVRWINEKTPSNDHRHVIHLQKSGTSLKTVVKTLLADATSGPLAQLAADVERLSSEVDQAGLEQRLLNQMQEALAAAQPVPGTARVLAGPKGLAVLLLDPHVRDHLLRPGRLIPRLAAHLLADRHTEDPDRPATFTVDDLPLDIADVRAASQMAQKLLALLHRAELQPPAVEMLNRHLDVAVMNATNLGVGRLQHALLDIRREFARQGKEIVLLVEDFALIQGIQRDLLDAVIEAGIREGRPVLAPMRTLLAVTTGYYKDLAETVLTRAKAATPYVYDLDVQFDDSEHGTAEVTAFVGRYLNAARLGRDEMDRLEVQSAAETPNACDGCEMRSDCHVTFGTSTEGHGLYPFNPAALLRAIDARTPKGGPRTFNPRRIVGEVVRNVLVEHAQALADGTFPDARFVEDYPTKGIDRPRLSSAVRNAIETADPTDAERRATVLEFWGDAPPRLTNLDPVLHQAFALELLDVETTVPSRSPHEPAARTSPQQPVVPGDLPPSVARAIHDVEEWESRKKPLRTQTAADIRSIICEAVQRRCQWNDPLMPEPSAEVLTRRAWSSKSITVSIEGAEAENLPGTADAPIRFRRTPANSVFFQGLLAARAGKIAGNAENVRRLAHIADRYQGDLIRRVQQTQASTDDRLLLALRASLLGACLAGQAGPGMDEGQLLSAVLDEGRDWSRGDTAVRTYAWLQAWERHQAARVNLVAGIRLGFGISRGVGAVRMVDAARALPLLRSAAEGWTWPTPVVEPANWVKKAVGGFGGWDLLVDAQVEALADRLCHIRTLLPKGTRGMATVEAVADALDAALPVALGPRDDADGFRQMVKEAANLDWRIVDHLEHDLERARATEQPEVKRRQALLTAAARDRGRDLEAIGRFLHAADDWLTGALAAARMRESRVGDGARDRLQDVTRRWSEIGGGESA